MSLLVARQLSCRNAPAPSGRIGARISDALGKRLRNTKSIRLDRREPGKASQRRGDIGAVQRAEAVVAATVQLALQEIDRNIAQVDSRLERVAPRVYVKLSCSWFWSSMRLTTENGVLPKYANPECSPR